MSSKISNALALAVKAHAGVCRKYGDEPYSNHVIRVAFEVARTGADEDVIAAALLHDVLEDTDVPPETIRDTVGERVLKIVQELTNPSHLPENKRKLRAERKRIDREHLKTVSKEAKLIKLLDRTDNLRDVVRGPRDFQELYANESLTLLEAMRGEHPDQERDLETMIRALLAFIKV